MILIVCNKYHFWDFYSELKNTDRKYYEIINESCPVKLYFDLEYYMIEQNVDKNGKLLTDKFISIVNLCIKNMLGVENSINDVLILDSCSFKKYSVHLIFPKIIFASYLSCREFVNCVLRLVSAENLDDFMVTSNRGKQVLFIDSCVYSKNQSFRQVIHYGFILHSLK